MIGKQIALMRHLEAFCSCCIQIPCKFNSREVLTNFISKDCSDSRVKLQTTISNLFLGGGKSLQSLIQSLFIVSHSYQSNLSNFWWICSFSGWICSFSGLKSSFLGWISSFLLLDYFYSINYRYISCLPCMLMREAHTLSMCRHNNEGNPLTEHVQSLYWACADIIMRGNSLTMTQYLRDSIRD